MIPYTCTLTYWHLQAYLKSNDVCWAVNDLLQQNVPTIFPVEGPCGAVAIHLTSSILVTQYVVGHHCDTNWKKRREKPVWREDKRGRRERERERDWPEDLLCREDSCTHSLSGGRGGTLRLSRRNVSSLAVPFTSFTMSRMSGWRGFPVMPRVWWKSKDNNSGKMCQNGQKWGLISTQVEFVAKQWVPSAQLLARDYADSYTVTMWYCKIWYLSIAHYPSYTLKQSS